MPILTRVCLLCTWQTGTGQSAVESTIVAGIIAGVVILLLTANVLIALCDRCPPLEHRGRTVARLLPLAVTQSHGSRLTAASCPVLCCCGVADCSAIIAAIIGAVTGIVVLVRSL